MRIKDKIQEIENYLEELESVFPLSLDEYKKSFKLKAIGERYFEKILVAIIDLAFLIIKEKCLKIPEEEKEAFDILEKSNIISEKLCEKLKDAKGMRNIIAHEYGKIDDEVVFHALTEELVRDTNEFIRSISDFLKLK